MRAGRGLLQLRAVFEAEALAQGTELSQEQARILAQVAPLHFVMLSDDFGPHLNVFAVQSHLKACHSRWRPNSSAVRSSSQRRWPHWCWWHQSRYPHPRSSLLWEWCLRPSPCGLRSQRPCRSDDPQETKIRRRSRRGSNWTSKTETSCVRVATSLSFSAYDARSPPMSAKTKNLITKTTHGPDTGQAFRSSTACSNWGCLGYERINCHRRWHSGRSRCRFCMDFRSKR